MPLQIFLKGPQAPFGTNPITVSIFVGYKAWLMLVHAVVGHMHAPAPAQIILSMHKFALMHNPTERQKSMIRCGDTRIYLKYKFVILCNDG